MCGTWHCPLITCDWSCTFPTTGGKSPSKNIGWMLMNPNDCSKSSCVVAHKPINRVTCFCIFCRSFPHHTFLKKSQNQNHKSLNKRYFFFHHFRLRSLRTQFLPKKWRKEGHQPTNQFLDLLIALQCFVQINTNTNMQRNCLSSKISKISFMKDRQNQYFLFLCKNRSFPFFLLVWYFGKRCQ